MTMYHVDFASSVTDVECKIFHAEAHFVDGLSCVTRIARALFSANDIALKVFYALRL
jgi:hypothetical protein